jgi:hypothetical protein
MVAGVAASDFGDVPTAVEWRHSFPIGRFGLPDVEEAAMRKNAKLNDVRKVGEQRRSPTPSANAS